MPVDFQRESNMPPATVHALVVGIDHYLDPRIGNLSYAARDAESVYEALDQTFNNLIPNIHLLLNAEATLLNVRRVFGEIIARAAQPHDLVLFYLAGHGSPEIGQSPDTWSRYLVMHDTVYDSIYASALELNLVFPQMLGRINSDKVVAFIDACFSGLAGGRTFEGPAIRIRRDRRAHLQPLADLDLGEGRIIMTACDDDEVALESAALRHGIFTHSLLTRLDLPRDGTLTIPIGTLYDRVASDVRDLTNNRQTPIFNGRSRKLSLPFPRLGAEGGRVNGSERGTSIDQ